MDSQPTNAVLEEIKELLYEGRKIEAVKRYRAASGKGLADAKDDVEKLEKELRAKSPEKFKAQQGKGCLGVIAGLACAVLGWLVWAWVV